MNQLRELSFEGWRLLLVSLALLPLTALSLWLLGFKKTQSILTYFANTQFKSKLSETEQMIFAKRVARIVSIAANHGLYRANCLKKSFVIWWLLVRKGVAVELKIGVNNDDTFQAHAWVEFGGKVLAGSYNGNEVEMCDSYVVLVGQDHS